MTTGSTQVGGESLFGTGAERDGPAGVSFPDGGADARLEEGGYGMGLGIGVHRGPAGDLDGPFDGASSSAWHGLVALEATRRATG